MNAEIEQLLDLEKSIGSSYVAQSLNYKLGNNPYNLTETEFLLIRMLVSNGQSLIQSHLYNGTAPTVLESLLVKYLDAAIEKLPKEDTTEIVFRVTSNSLFTPQDVGKEVIIPAYLTASKKLLSTNDNCVYVIRLNGRTKAKSLYKAYEIMPQLPEEQVEFPRNTKFYVEDVCSKGGKTVVELWEMPDNKWPAEQLTNNVSDFFKDIKTIDIQDAVRKGINPRIHFMSTHSGRNICAECADKGEVYVSPAFAQALWNLCYEGLWLSDTRILNEEYGKMGTTLKQVCEEIDKEQSEDVQALYLKGIYDAANYQKDLFSQIDSLLKNQYNERTDVFLGKIDPLGAFEQKVGGLYKTGMGCMLLHELTHYNNDHFKRLAKENVKDLEQEADNKAFEAILALTGKERETAILGGIASYLLLFYMNPSLLPLKNYYREDRRLFVQYDKIDNKRNASIFVANVLSRWLKDNHSISVELKHNHEEETVEEIRRIINGL